MAGDLTHTVLRIVLQAMQRRATRIHLEPIDFGHRVRARIDHELVELERGGEAIGDLAAEVRRMCDLDVTETRLPQDGTLRIENGERISLFVSIVPGHVGPKIVFDVVQPHRASLALDELGLDAGPLERLRRAIRWPGAVLLAGPTHSGRHAMLYAALTELEPEPRSLGSVEDPVRFRLDGVHQLGVDDDVGRSFGTCLRAHERVDTEVIGLGDVRDAETAELIAQAAVRGRTVIAAIHTRDAPSTLERLVHMGVDPWLVAEAVTLVQAQRLLRRLCAHCKVERAPGGFEPEGCPRCNHTGHSGVVLVAEQLVVDRTIAAAIAKGADLAGLAIERGMVTLRQHALAKRAAGLVSMAEVAARTPPDVAG